MFKSFIVQPKSAEKIKKENDLVIETLVEETKKNQILEIENKTEDEDFKIRYK